MGYRSYWPFSQVKYRKENEERKRQDAYVHASGSVASSILGGGINPCEAAASMRAVFATWGSPMPPSVGDLLLAGAIAEGIEEPCPVSGIVLGRIVW
jgi:hypothetical protein